MTGDNGYHSTTHLSSGRQAFSQDFERGSPNFMRAEGPHSIAPQALCS